MELYEDVLARMKGRLYISPVNYVEACMRIVGTGSAEFAGALEHVMKTVRISLVPVDEDQATLAIEAHRRFGKGRHAARLNLGDCFAYALAKKQRMPLLFKGNDFTKTDIEAAL